ILPAGCSTLQATTAKEGPMTMQILVPLDGSTFSEQALDCACELAQRVRADLHLVRVQEPTVLHSTDFANTYNTAVYGELWQAAREYIGAQAIKASGTYGVTTRSATLNGPVAQAISAYVARAGIDMIVMASHGRTGFGRVLLGSVADALARTVT